jgi:hypothetical protein
VTRAAFTVLPTSEGLPSDRGSCRALLHDGRHRRYEFGLVRAVVASSSEQLPVVREIAEIVNDCRRFEAKPWAEEIFVYS